MSRFGYFVVAVLSALPLAGCDPDYGTGDNSPNGFALENLRYSAQVLRAHRYIAVVRGSGNLSEPERADLAGFIAEQANGRPSAVHVELTGLVTAAEMTQLTRVLVADGVDPDKIEYNANKAVEGQAPAGRAGTAMIDVETERWKPVLPNCPDQSRLSIVTIDNPDSSDFGCSEQNNVEAMVADPRDLVQGEAGGHTDAGLTTAAIGRLENDKTKPLISSGTMSSGSGGSN
jgi:pilus assembly protein CpaD